MRDESPNRAKLQEIQKARNKLCEYLNKNHKNSTWLVDTITKICERVERLLRAHEFKLETSQLAENIMPKSYESMITTSENQ